MEVQQRGKDAKHLTEGKSFRKFNHKKRLSFFSMNQIHISKFLLCLIQIIYTFFPDSVAHKFIRLQYQMGKNEQGEPIYDIGVEDCYFVIHWIIILTFLRAYLMEKCFRAYAEKRLHIKSRKAKTRFREQSWSFVYYSSSFIFGVYLYVGAPYQYDIDALYANWPHYQLSLLFKKYYLIAIAFWLQQIFVLNVEEKRKDHLQMFSHHIITCLLLIGSYYYYFNRIGHLILMIMDSVDVLLALAKVLKYAGYQKMCHLVFGLFLISWILLRHVAYNWLYYHAWNKSTSLMLAAKCGTRGFQKRCWDGTVIYGFLSLLGGLQIVTIIWLILILKVAYNVMTGKGGEDIRSDDDEKHVLDETKK